MIVILQRIIFTNGYYYRPVWGSNGISIKKLIEILGLISSKLWDNTWNWRGVISLEFICRKLETEPILIIKEAKFMNLENSSIIKRKSWRIQPIKLKSVMCLKLNYSPLTDDSKHLSISDNKMGINFQILIFSQNIFKQLI